jgi:hypothetical protein
MGKRSYTTEIISKLENDLIAAWLSSQEVDPVEVYGLMVDDEPPTVVLYGFLRDEYRAHYPGPLEMDGGFSLARGELQTLHPAVLPACLQTGGRDLSPREDEQCVS